MNDILRKAEWIDKINDILRKEAQDFFVNVVWTYDEYIDEKLFFLE